MDTMSVITSVLAILLSGTKVLNSITLYMYKNGNKVTGA